jgi:hypothetical protein
MDVPVAAKTVSKTAVALSTPIGPPSDPPPQLRLNIASSGSKAGEPKMATPQGFRSFANVSHRGQEMGRRAFEGWV